MRPRHTWSTPWKENDRVTITQPPTWLFAFIHCWCWAEPGTPEGLSWVFGTGRDTNGDRARSVATDTVSWRYTAKGILEKKGNIGIKRKGELPESLPSPGSRILNQVQKRKGKWWRQKFSARARSVQTNTFCPAKKSTLEIHNHPHRH